MNSGHAVTSCQSQSRLKALNTAYKSLYHWYCTPKMTSTSIETKTLQKRSTNIQKTFRVCVASLVAEKRLPYQLTQGCGVPRTHTHTWDAHIIKHLVSLTWIQNIAHRVEKRKRSLPPGLGSWGAEFRCKKGRKRRYVFKCFVTRTKDVRRL